MTKDNMDLWNKVCKTDPKYTKNVRLGRRHFTAIDPMYQVKKATEFLGRVGKGWGFEIMDTTFLPTDYVAVKIRVWVGSREDHMEHIGMCGLYMNKEKTSPDGDCIKKAVTDGITKGLSYFGFSADVFLGQYDDIKYVQELKKEQEEKEKRVRAESWVNEYIKSLEGKDKNEVTNIQTENAAMLKRIEDGYPDLHKGILKQRATND